MNKKTHTKLHVTGIYEILPGIILMLLPIEPVGLYLDLAGFLLITSGLIQLWYANGGFQLSLSMGVLCTALTVALFFVEAEWLAAAVPLCYCVLLYDMCTSFAKLSFSVGDHHMGKHFISHMWMDIAATLAETAVHLLGLPHVVVYVFIAIAIFFELMLMVHMYKFYRLHEGQAAGGPARARVKGPVPPS